ncbi:G-protein coupled receptor moody-like [Uloborus diversus]|uniref:G-protein coupled receptor moody-like n=1 Tax=Uloborus diversus TaxID=327109 RepID=UPI00240953D4|nr:G-protein coupled receptor moody-like [Uloborus diversus]
MNQSLEHPFWDNRPSSTSCIFAACFSIFFILVGCVGNGLTILALPRCRRLRNATTTFVVSLAIADFLFCIVCLPLTATRYIYEEWILGPQMCTLFPFFFYGNVAASLMSMTAITFNRFVLINCYPVYNKIYSRLNVAFMVATCWIFSYAILLPTLTGYWGRFGYDEASFSCTILKNKDGKSPKKFLFSFAFLLPTVTIVLCYSCIFYKVRSSALKVLSHDTPGDKRNSRFLPRKRDDIRVTCTMLASFCTFQICFLPLLIMNVFEEDIRYPILHILASVLAWMSACSNPFIYVLLNKHYREAYFQLLCSWKVLKANRSVQENGTFDSSRAHQLRTVYGEESKESQLSVSRDVAM